MTANGYGVSVWDDENVLILVLIALLNIQKNTDLHNSKG